MTSDDHQYRSLRQRHIGTRRAIVSLWLLATNIFLFPSSAQAPPERSTKKRDDRRSERAGENQHNRLELLEFERLRPRNDLRVVELLTLKDDQLKVITQPLPLNIANIESEEGPDIILFGGGWSNQALPDDAYLSVERGKISVAFWKKLGKVSVATGKLVYLSPQGDVTLAQAVEAPVGALTSTGHLTIDGKSLIALAFRKERSCKRGTGLLDMSGSRDLYHLLMRQDFHVKIAFGPCRTDVLHEPPEHNREPNHKEQILP